MHLFLLTLVLAADPEPIKMEWTVDGTQREALVYRPTKQTDTGSPIVFAFHGHGGNSRNADRTIWPEALVVYMQGIPTPGRLTDPQGKRNGWQHDVGDQGDRDLKFFDAVLERLRNDYKTDGNRIYATGHSNGGGFTYLLWAERPDVFAAVAPSAAASRSLLKLNKPKPVMHIAGENDELVKFAIQQRAMDRVREINGCADKGEEWATGCLQYASKHGTPFVSYIHPGTHKYPAEAPALIVKFFKDHTRKPAAAKP
jgi:polyhydroxybutyrate depolymerase